MGNDFDSLKDKLMKKLENEMLEYKNSLKEKSPEEIIQNAYELTVKQEIIDVYDYDLCFSRKDLRRLIKEPDLLDQAYCECLPYDGNLREAIISPLNHLNKTISQEKDEEEER